MEYNNYSAPAGCEQPPFAQGENSNVGVGLLKRFPWLFIAVGLFGACFILIAQRVPAQTASPTPEQLQMFQGLTPEQQQSILQSIGGGGSLGGLGGGLGSAGSNSGLPGSRGMQSDSRQLGQQNRRASQEEEEPEPVIPELKAQDWVIIEIDYQLPPRPVPPYLQSLYSAQAAAPASNGATPGLALPPAPPAAALGAAATGQPAATSAPDSNNAMVPEDKARLDALMVLIRSKNPYQLSRDGTLSLPGFPPMELLGLTEEQATLRLKAEPTLRGMDIRLTRLPLKKTGVEGLKPFGYDLFDHAPSTFAPVTDVPVPSDYIVGAGDQLQVQLYGSQNRVLKLTVARDGSVNFPELGPITVAGQNFNRVKESLESRV